MKGYDDMNKVTLREYAIMIEHNVQYALNLAMKANALSTEGSCIYVDVDKVRTHMDDEIISSLKIINGRCV